LESDVVVGVVASVGGADVVAEDVPIISFLVPATDDFILSATTFSDDAASAVSAVFDSVTPSGSCCSS
jgi:hypothetical protein